MKAVAIGVDIGGTNTAIGIIDKDGNCLYVVGTVIILSR